VNAKHEDRLSSAGFWAAATLLALAGGWGVAQTPAPAPAAVTAAKPIPPPDWLFPIDPASLRPPATPPKLDDVELLGIPDSQQQYTLARINDRFNAPDWFPGKHAPLPEVVARGRKPDVIACAFCHTPTGQGRPENSALAGLPEAYFKQQLHDFRSGARKVIGPEQYLPSRGMHAVAAAMTEAEIEETARFFAQQKLARRVWVVESLRIPRAEPSDWVYMEVGGTEDLDGRMLEVAPDITRHQRRDDVMQYLAYVPPGSIARGKRLATTGDGGKTVVCSSCHLQNLKGTEKIPPIAGRSPTYLLRQLLAFRNGTRTGPAAQEMTPTVEKLELDDMVDLVAYVSSLYP
jgi:cytochrome c553